MFTQKTKKRCNQLIINALGEIYVIPQGLEPWTR
jgi:hypothetical protein